MFQLFKDCLRLADYVGSQVTELSASAQAAYFVSRAETECLQSGDQEVLKQQVRLQFKRNAGETDRQKVR